MEEGREFTIKLAIKMIFLKEPEFGLKLVLCEDEKINFLSHFKRKSFCDSTH